MRSERVLLIARKGTSTNIIYHALATRFNVRVIFETSPSMSRLLRLRARQLGLGRVCGQVLFHFLIAFPLHLFSSGRRKMIIAQAGLNNSAPPAMAITGTPSVNSRNCMEQIATFQPHVIVINGTRILNKATLASIDVPILNTHAGITPKYRGVHGGYWALVNDDPEHCGVTVHLVDSGIDTGGILKQALIRTTSKDNFTTYPILQAAVGCGLMIRAICQLLDGTQKILGPTTTDGRWYHPTLWEYLLNRLRSGIR